MKGAEKNNAWVWGPGYSRTRMEALPSMRVTAHRENIRMSRDSKGF